MINLIRNELYKIFHKKGIYIVLIITLLFSILTNYIYSEAGGSYNYLEEDYKIESDYVKLMEELGETDNEEYFYGKVNLAMYEYSKTFGKDSWQRYIIHEDMTYYEKTYDIITRILEYEYKRSNNKIDYENALKEKEALTNEFKNLTWKEFAEKEIEKAKTLQQEAPKEEKNYYQATIDALNLRIKHDIIYKYDDFNEYLRLYEENRAIQLSYLDKDEKTLKQEDKDEKNRAIKEVELNKYKIENKIEEVPAASSHYLLTVFYDEYFIMILVFIVLISGSIVSDEFSKGTIKLLLVKPYTRTKILLSKYLTVLIMLAVALISAFAMQMIIGGLFFGYESLNIPYITYDIATKSIESISILKYFLLYTLSVLPHLVILTTLGFTLSTISTSTSLANTFTIIGAFGSSIIGIFAQNLELEWIKYVVTLNWDFTCYLFGGSSPYKGITLPFSITICLIYLLVMIIISFVVFKKRNIKNI